MRGCSRWHTAWPDEEKTWTRSAKTAADRLRDADQLLRRYHEDAEHQVEEHLLVPAHPDRAAAVRVLEYPEHAPGGRTYRLMLVDARDERGTVLGAYDFTTAKKVFGAGPVEIEIPENPD